MVFPDGDRGGNSIKTRQSKNLHALWDGLLGPKWDEGALKRRADEMPQPREVGVNCRSSDIPVLDIAAGGIETWLEESRDAAVSTVYAPEVMEPVSVALRAKGEVPQVDLSEAYLKNAGAVATQRAAEAASRLATAWNSN